MDFPMTIAHPDYKCPVCGRKLVIRGIRRWVQQGLVPLNGIELTCISEPKLRHTSRHRKWYQAHWEDPDGWMPVRDGVYQWFNRYYRYGFIEPEVLSRKRRLKWRRAG
jgi:hypothetical protein